MSTLKIRLVGADSYSFRKKKFVRGRLYELPEAEADELLEKEDGRGYSYFELPHEREVKGEETHEPTTTSATERRTAKNPARKKATKKAAKKTLRVSGGNVTGGDEGGDESDAGETGEDGDEGVEV